MLIESLGKKPSGSCQNEPQYLIIPAAGVGTRMRTVNPGVPKEMLPIGNKPAIQYAVEEGISAGIKNIIIIISHHKEIIRQYFEDKSFRKKLYPLTDKEVEDFNKKCSLTFLYQKEPLGESDAISYAKDIASKHSIAIIYPDNLYLPAPRALKILKQVYNQYKKDVIGLMKVTDENASGISYSGIVNVEHKQDALFEIKAFLPKKSGYFVPRFKEEIRACGIGISGPYLFDYIDRLKDTITEGEFTDFPVRSLILKEKGTLGYLLPGTVFDIGNPEGYKQCLEYIARYNGKK
jgi:UTP--glucose-1-phosphate uridylyltransferase